jgi:hypothetical protein
MKRSIVSRGILTLSVTVALVAIPVSSAMADRTLDPGTVDFGPRQVGTTSPAQTHELRAFCDAPQLVCIFIALAGGDPFDPNVSVTGDFAQTNDCVGILQGALPQGQSCSIQTVFTPTSPGPKEGILSTGPDGPTATLTGVGVAPGTPITPMPPDPGPPTEPAPDPTLDLDAKKQELKKKVKFFAESDQDATLVVGGGVKTTDRELVAGERRKVKAKPKKRGKLERKLANTGKAKVKIEAAATNDAGSTAVDQITVKLRD